MRRDRRTPDDPLHRFLARQVARGRLPGATWWVGRGGRVLASGAVGRTAVTPDAAAVRESTPFDLASLTKALVTAPLLVLLEQEGALDLDAPLSSLLGELAALPLGSRTLAALAAHRADLPAWAPLCVRARDLEGYLSAIASLPLRAPPGGTRYSDPGYILLGAAIGRATGRDLAALFDERIARPLGLERTGFAAGERSFADAAATERGNHWERAMAGGEGAAHPWREEIPPGEVHDANAHGLGGVAGHAGLFGTAAEVARLGSALLEPEPLGLGERARARLLRATPSAEGRTVGLVLAACSRAARGILPDEAPGHTGFTGTSLWLDPPSRRCFVLLTNRVHPRVPGRDFQPLRRAFHRLALRRPPSR